MPGFHPRHFIRDRSGAISIIAALSLAMLLAIAAIVIDAGSLYFSRRSLQATSDAAALAAVQNPASATAIAADVFSRNGYSSPTLVVTTGTYSANESLDAGARFTAGSSNMNAVRVKATLQKSVYFGTFMGLGQFFPIVTQSTAARVPTASFGAGTAVAQLNAGLTNALLGKLWGSSVSLSLIDYQALLNTNVDTLTFFNQLATDISVTGTYQQLANTSVTTGQILTALVETLNTSGAASAARQARCSRSRACSCNSVPCRR